MNDDQKTKEQLLEELAQGRALLERAEERSLALQEVSKRVAAAHDTDEVLDLIVNEAARLLGASGSFLMFPDEGELVAGAATESAATFVDGITEVRPKIAATAEASPISRVMVTKEPWTTEDAQVDEKVTPLGRLFMRKTGFRGFTAVPLLANGQSLGVLSVMDTRFRRFTEDEISILAAFADQAALALEKARLLNEAETERERADSLYRVSNLLAGTHCYSPRRRIHLMH